MPNRYYSIISRILKKGKRIDKHEWGVKYRRYTIQEIISLIGERGEVLTLRGIPTISAISPLNKLLPVSCVSIIDRLLSKISLFNKFGQDIGLVVRVGE